MFESVERDNKTKRGETMSRLKKLTAADFDSKTRRNLLRHAATGTPKITLNGKPATATDGGDCVLVSGVAFSWAAFARIVNGSRSFQD